MSRKAKIYIRTTISFTLIFAIVAALIIGVIWGKEFLSGGLAGLDDDSMQKSHINVLLCGVDKDGYRTDVLILAQMNLINNTINMVQISRDTYVSINHLDKKINSAYGYNKEKQLFKEVEYILPGIKVDKYMLVNIKGFREIVDAIGGVKFNVPLDMDYDDPYQDLHIHLSKGEQTLDGKEAEQLVRFRKDNEGVDIESLTGGISRIDMQRDFIYATIKQVLSIKNVMKIPKLISIATDNLETNLDYEDFERYAPLVLNLDTDAINIMSLPGDDDIIGGGWYFISDPDATAQMVAQHFTPAVDEISTQELAIRNQLIGDSETKSIPQGLVLTEEFKNRFLTVDIIDGSGGTADIDAVIRKIEDYGFTVKDVSEASTVDYPKTIIIAKKDNQSGAKIAKAIGVDEFRINTEKRNNSSVTVIVGDDLKGE